MKFAVSRAAGSGPASADPVRRATAVIAGLFAAALLPTAAVQSQALYKYRGPDGEWIFTDRRPADDVEPEVRELPVSSRAGTVTLSELADGGIRRFFATSTLHAPVHLRALTSQGGPSAAPVMEWLLPPLGSVELLSANEGTDAALAARLMRYRVLLGDPAAEHRPDGPYRAPFPAAVSYPVSQAWPDTRTHTTPDSAHAVDIAMPVGSDVLAARGGIVVEVSSSNFRNSDSPDGDGAVANIVRILHDDGTFAIYAHLNWNSIRVRPGQQVVRGEYIADSGNTGFSTGPHLHFAVLKNNGQRLVSLPVTFALPDGSGMAPAAGTQLTAY